MKCPKKICIISHQHLCRNPRVLKEAIALEKLDFKVTLLTSVHSVQLLEEDYKLLKDTAIDLIFYNNLIIKDFSAFKNRLFQKAGRWLNKFRFENKYALGYAPNKCLQLALLENADLYICHQELPTYIGTRLLKSGKKVAFDFEDFYSEDLLAKDRKYRPQKKLEAAERYALNFGHLCYTTSNALADGLQTKYNAKVRPKVVFNSFPSYFTSKENNNSPIQLIWLSQTIGSGRGIEAIIVAMNNCTKNKFILNLRGHVGAAYRMSLMRLLTNNSHEIIFLPLITNEAIQEDLTNYQLGLATELNTPMSRNLTITNKIFHYLSVGLPVIATTTKGQLSLATDFKNGIHYYSTTNELAKLLDELDPVILNGLQSYIAQHYASKYDWAVQEKHLQQMISEII